MAWFWSAYLPNVERRAEPFASPTCATDEQLAGLPPAFLIVDEADLLLHGADRVAPHATAP